MDQAPLVNDEINAGAELVRRLEKSMPVQAAFWIKDGEGGPWFLYLASDQIHNSDLDWAYGEVLRVAAEMGNAALDQFRVRVIPISDPLAQSALEIYRRFPGVMPSRLGATKFGESWVDGVYVYPARLAATVP
jgi:hypothetical protein